MKYISDKEHINKLILENEQLRARNAELELTANISFVKMAEQGLIDNTTATEHIAVFSNWGSCIKYRKNEIRKYNEELYKCLQAHTSQDDLTPDVSSTLWKKIGDSSDPYPTWSQPVGAVDAYMKDATVTHKTKHYISTIDDNMWEPGIYGWDEI